MIKKRFAFYWAGFGAIPKPTVQSGWEKMEVLQTFKKCRF
ncbi:hypothetical protein KIS1582_0042 [Cytobacillus firmus]|uniref:Uncharacterized protein n=1 Tax=Cytobacillus firmus TaxID=1399 RepID=A0A800NG48_CYTFI|nr:hypothetical protein KIS1582_0042 [Cytobacillus firmus]